MPIVPAPQNEARDPSILEIVDALILYDTPLLDQRFQDTIAMHPDARMRAMLAVLPQRVATGARLTRRAGVEWERVQGSGRIDARFKARAERSLLEAFLDSAEAQIRLKAFLAREAPSPEVRDLIDQALEIHRELVVGLRRALHALEGASEPEENIDAVPSAAAAPEDLPARVLAAVQAASAGGRKPRRVVLSPLALRELRMKGHFADGETSFAGVPVQLDLGWGGATFAVITMDSLPLDEIPPDPSRR